MNNDYEKELENLSKAVTNAIINSEDVKKAILALRDKEDFTSDGLMVLLLRVKSLIEAIDTSNDLTPNSLSQKNSKNFASPRIVDGKKLSPLEIAFEEYCMKEFDEKQWLNTYKLFFKKE